MDKFDRIYRLHQIFAGRRTPVALDELKRQLDDCSKATVHRLLDTLRNTPRAPVVFDRELGGYYYDKSANYELPGLWFTAEELQALVVFQRMLQTLEPGLLDEHLGPFRKRIEELMQHRRLGLAENGRRIRLIGIAHRPLGASAVTAGALRPIQQQGYKDTLRPALPSGSCATRARCVTPRACLPLRSAARQGASGARCSASAPGS